MEILPKFKLGDTLWTVSGCKAKSFKVNAIVTKTTEKGTTIGYTESVNCYSEIPEAECFASKEDLIAQL